MSESGSIFKVIVTLGILIVFVGLIFPGSDAAWNSFQSTLNTGPNLPTFNNPFSANTLTDTLIPMGPGKYGAGLFNPALHGCTVAWSCIATQDDDKSYLEVVTPPSENGALEADMGSVPPPATPGRTIVDIRVNVWCKTVSGAEPFRFTLTIDNYDGIGAPSNLFFPRTNPVDYQCPVANYYTKVSFEFHDNNGLVWQDLVPDRGAGFILDMHTSYCGHISASSTSCTGSPTLIRARFTYVTVDVMSSDPAPGACTGDWFSTTACSISQFFSLLFNIFVFVVNGVTFVLVFVAQVLIFLGQVITGLFIGIFTIVAWFFAIPGAPIQVQAIIDTVFTGLVGWLVYMIARLVRGSGPV